MKRLLLMAIILLILPSCMTTTIPGMGFVQTDPGVRIYTTEDKVLVHITHKEGEEQPDYESIAKVIKEVFK